MIPKSFTGTPKSIVKIFQPFSSSYKMEENAQ